MVSGAHEEMMKVASWLDGGEAKSTSRPGITGRSSLPNCVRRYGKVLHLKFWYWLGTIGAAIGGGFVIGFFAEDTAESAWGAPASDTAVDKWFLGDA